MGVSVLYSAGNTGVAGMRGYCLDDNGMSFFHLSSFVILTKPFFVGSLNLNGTNFTPNWPASCPWVTVVGGTQVKPSAAASNSSSALSGSSKTTTSAGSQTEEVWNQDLTSGFFVSSGGGFSNRFSTPAYQRSAVQAYLKALGNDGKGKFNAKGVGFLFLPNHPWKDFRLIWSLSAPESLPGFER